ncbi:MAG: hypothetical protein AAF235_11610, partial [Planctomycetota bacterium]
MNADRTARLSSFVNTSSFDGAASVLRRRRGRWTGPSSMALTSMALTSVALASVSLLAGCTVNALGPLPGERRVSPDDPGGPFAPSLIRVFPLTRFVLPAIDEAAEAEAADAGAEGGADSAAESGVDGDRRETGGDPAAAELIVHIEMLDRWGDATKGAGELRIVASPRANLDRAEAVTWDVDLRDLRLNAALY